MLEWLVDAVGEAGAAAIGGALIGLLFGAAAERSRFCLRAAAVDFFHLRFTDRIAVWLLAFSAALIATRLAFGWELISPARIRQLSAPMSVSGAVFGGLLFGAGMVLARGCSSRLLVLSATGNLRALLAGLVFAVTAQASLRGALSPLRDWMAGLWTIGDPKTLDALAVFGLGETAGLVIGLIWFAAGIGYALRSGLRLSEWLGAIGVGLAVAAGWTFTSGLAELAFDPTPVHSLSFTGPSANTLMYVLNRPTLPDFDTALVPGVFAGAFLAAWLGGTLRLEGFEGGRSMRRYLAGAVMMGFGGMLAGGCAVGAGVSGAAVFATVAWITLVAMWVGAGLTDRLLTQPEGVAAPSDADSIVKSTGIA